MSDDTVYLNWPVKFQIGSHRSSWRTWCRTHGIQMTGKFHAWVFHLGPLKVVFGEAQGERLKAAFNDGLTVGLRVQDTFTREWMLQNVVERKEPK